MSFRKQLDPVGSPLKFGKKQMLMARVRDNMTSQAFWALTKKNYRKIYPASSLVLSSQTVNTIQKLWQDFGALYSIVASRELSDEDMTAYFERAKGWVNLFTSLRDERIGYKRANVTPYMHAMVYHIPTFFEKYRAVKLFTGQGVEKNNGMARSIVLHKSDK